MPEQIKDWDGGEWQQHIARLLRVHYPEPGSYQEMPSNDKGDLGLEGFSRDGICYQCYAAELPYTIRTLYEKQRAKITDDIGKFIGNVKRLSVVFGTLRIKRWLLVVPCFHSTQLLEHCTKKKEKVLKAQLPYVDNVFDIGIVTDEEFELELRRLSSVRLFQHDITVADPASTKIQSFAKSNIALLTTVSTKAAKLPKLATTEKIDDFTFQMVKHYLRGELAVSGLRARDPEQFETFLRCKQSMEDLLVMQSMVQMGDANTLRDTFSKFNTEVQKHLSISPHTADVIAWGAVADWLLRCPLDF